MTPYPTYKPTGLPWLPQIPEHWKLVRNKNVLSEQKDIVGENASQYNLLSLTLSGVILRDMENCKGKFPAEFDSYKIVHPGNIIFCLFDIDETPRCVGLAPHSGMITGAYDVFSINISEPRFLFYYYLNIDNQKALKPYYTGLRKVVSVSRFLGLQFPVPPPDEQTQIVRYLDSMTAKINKLIRAKKKQIALLQEQKQAIINQAVTKGLNPNAEMKDSGIDWLGKIPKHWILNKVGHFYKSILGKMLENAPSSHHDSLEKYLCAKDVHFYGIDLTDLKKMWFSPEEKMKYQVSAGDLLVVEGGAGAGGAAVFDGDSENLYIQNSIYIVRPKNRNMSVLFLYFWLYALVGRKYIDFACNKATIPHFTSDKLFETPFVLVPSREQNEISHYLHEKSREYDSVIDKLNNEITLMDEYKNSMISSIVSGQADIRNIPVDYFDPADLVSEDVNNTEEPTAEESEE